MQRNDLEVTQQQICWEFPPSDIVLEKCEIHVWRVLLNATPMHIQLWEKILAPDELQRANRFYFERDRNRFIQCRALLRKTLAFYLNIPSQQISFEYNKYGKPELKADNLESKFYFNISHSADLALFAFSRDYDIGIDVEKIKPDFGGLEIASRFFSPGEISDLLNVEEDLQNEAFFNCWTRKEAFIKAIGDGLSLPLDGFDVSLAPGKPPKIKDIRFEIHKDSEWSLFSLFPYPNYVASIATKGNIYKLKYWQWHPSIF